MKKDKKKVEVTPVPNGSNSAPKQPIKPQSDISVSKATIEKVSNPFDKFAASVPADLKAPQNVAPKAQNPVVGGAVLKPVAGGLQPIIAPKGQVQLQPVVVPVAFVPYATQNQPMLQYDKKERLQERRVTELSDQPLDKTVAPSAKKGKKSDKIVAADEICEEEAPFKAKGSRIGALLVFLANFIFLVPALLLKFKPDLEIMGTTIENMAFPDIIGGLSTNFSAIGNNIGWLIFFVGHAFAVINMLLSLVVLISGKNLKVWISQLLMFIVVAFGTVAGFLALGTAWFPAKLAGGVTVGIPIGANSGAWRLLAIALLTLIVSVMFRGKKPKKEKKNKKNKNAEEVEAA